mmetsp:Transcript_110685/g.214359  ORF Transcript_110685/g.214359 Transcript_110685/m.214359 type:complete len:91 (-) Transcript_110685:776-1048(-)
MMQGQSTPTGHRSSFFRVCVMLFRHALLYISKKSTAPKLNGHAHMKSARSEPVPGFLCRRQRRLVVLAPKCDAASPTQVRPAMSEQLLQH